MLDDLALSPDDVILLIPAAEGTNVTVAGDDEAVVELVESGDFTVREALRADLVLPEISELLNLKMA